uniref:Uncharacterized protein n=1 Tax=Arundo donax TaxID=35708 RepID=A0A0A9ECG2_ARUDO
MNDHRLPEPRRTPPPPAHWTPRPRRPRWRRRCGTAWTRRSSWRSGEAEGDAAAEEGEGGER